MGRFNANFPRESPVEECVASAVPSLAIRSGVVNADSQNRGIDELVLIRVHDTTITHDGEIVNETIKNLRAGAK
jgi:hypothetical protein